jgi:predicted permease
MTRLRRLVNGFRALMHMDGAEQELNKELGAYLETSVEQQIRASIAREDAIRATRVEIGGLGAVKDNARDAGWEVRLDSLWRDARYAVRALRRSPAFSAGAILTLALALASTATLLNLLEAFVFRRLAVPAPDQLIGIYPLSGEASVGFSAQALQALGARQQVLTGICGVTAGYGTLGVRFDSGAVTQNPYEAVTGNCYELLGVKALMGRLFAPEDVPISGDPRPVVLISDRVWRQKFGSSPDVLGRTVLLEGTPLTIIGVLPGTYRGLNADEAPDIALPITLPWKLRLHPPLAMQAVGRLRPGTGIGEAAAHLRAIWPEVFMSAQTANRVPRATPNLRVVPLSNGFSVLRELYRRPLYALVALGGSLLLLACVNVGGLSLARLLDRREAFAVQLALGAGRSSLAVQILCEATVIGAAATLLAIPVGWWGAQVAERFLWTGYRPFTLEATPITTTLLSTALIGVLAALFVAAPGFIALSVQNWDLGARSVGHGARSSRQRRVISSQIALCFVIAFCAALFTGNLYALRQLPLGYEPARLHWVRLDSTSRTGSGPSIGYADTVLLRIGALPGVERAAMSATFGTGVADRIPVRTDAVDLNSVDAISDRVSPGFFRTTLIPLQHGRDFTWNDVSGRANVAILNRSLAYRLFTNGDAVGRTVTVSRGPREQVVTVVGIAADATPGDPRIQRAPQLYFPLGPDAPPAPALLLRLRTENLTETLLREAIEPLGRHQVLRVSAMNEQVDQFFVQERLITSTSLLFAVLSGIVSIAGLYANMSQNIIRRTREIGIRIALGATPTMIRKLVLTEACWILLIGLGLGLPAAIAGGHAARSLLSGESISTMTLLAITGSSIAIVAMLVSVWPAQRAAHTQVATALRWE